MLRTATGGFAVVPLGEGIHRVVATEWGQDVDRDVAPTLDEVRASVRRDSGPTSP